MLYLDEKHILQMGIQWEKAIDIIKEAVKCLGNSDFAQPIKPYLRYRDLTNRIIAMPAFLGGEFNMAGIKWIASFPKNIEHQIPRAHSVIILNNADNGIPEAIINTPLLSIIRTASVSGLVCRYYMESRNLKSFNLGIIGWGPIGQYHYRMCKAIYGDRISNVYIYDLQEIDPCTLEDDRIPKTIAGDWEEVYDNSDVLATCTVSGAPYINRPPRPGSLLLNVSLRDFSTDIYPYIRNSTIVDDWDEICRENTDIENLHKVKGLVKQDTKSIIDVVAGDCIARMDRNVPVFFNPMGMAVFDIATATYYYKTAIQHGIGVKL